MNQIITQHGWGLDQSFWDTYKVAFQKNNWYWQDNERGYFFKNANQKDWIRNKSQKKIKMVFCHSYGFHLIQKSLFKEATHVVLINSFNNFLPLSNKKNLILKSIKKMEKKIIRKQTKEMLKEFINRSFMPNVVDDDFENLFNKKLDSINSSLLLEDLKKLYMEKASLEFLNKNSKIIFIKSENDLILDKDSSNDFFHLLNKLFRMNITLINLSHQGHCLSNLNLYQIIINTLKN